MNATTVDKPDGTPDRHDSDDEPIRLLRFNTRFAATALAVGLLAVGAVYVAHGFQVRRSSETLLQRAERLRDEGEHGQAVGYLRQYVGLKPGNIPAVISLGDSIEKTASKPEQLLEAYLIYENVLRQQPENADVRRRSIDLAIGFGRFGDARDNLGVLLKDQDANGELHFLLAICEEGSRNYEQAAEEYRQALSRKYTESPVYVRLATLYDERLEKPQAAEQVFDELLQARADQYEPYLLRARYRLRKGRFAAAKRDIDHAELLSPGNVDVVIARGEAAVADLKTSADEFKNVRDSMIDALKGHRDDVRLYSFLSQAELRLGNPEGAIDALQQGQEELPNELTLKWQLADLLIAEQKLEEARSQVERLRANSALNVFTQYLDGRLLLVAGKPVEAAEMLKNARTHIAAGSELESLIGQNLGRCYRLMGRFDDQLTEFRRAVDANPGSVPALLGMAEAQEVTGHLEEALKTYRGLIPKIGTAAVAQSARVILLQNLQRPSDQRDWQAALSLVDDAATHEPGSLDLALLKAQILRHSGRESEARDVLIQLRKQFPKEERILIGLAAIAVAEEDWVRATAILDEAVAGLGDTVDLRIARASLWAARGGDGASAQLAALEEDLERFTPPEQQRLQEELAATHFRAGRETDAARLWKTVAATTPYNTGAQLRLLTLAMRTEDEAGVEMALTNLRKTEGADGPDVLAAEALRLIGASSDGNSDRLGKARVLLTRVEAQRGNWPLVSLAQGRILELEGNLDAAINHYRNLVQSAEVDPAILRRAVGLLVARRRVEEADQLLAQVKDRVPAAALKEVRQLAAEASLRTRDYERALRLARETTAFESEDFQDQIWYGQMLAALGRPTEGEQVLRKAVQLEPAEPAPWMALVLFLARNNRLEDARTTLENAEQPLSGEQSALALCYEAIGDNERAGRKYQEAIENEPDNPSHLQLAAAFYLRTNQPAQAERLLKRVLDDFEPQSSAVPRASVRRLLAVAIARQRFSRFEEAIQLLHAESEESDDATENRRVEARLLAALPFSEHRLRAINLLEGLQRKEAATLSDRRLLAQLYDSAGDKKTADQAWDSLLSEDETDSTTIASFVRRQLDRNDMPSAQEWLSRLDSIDPDSFITVRLHAGFHSRQQRVDQAKTRIVSFIEQKTATDRDRAARLAQGIGLLESILDDSKVNQSQKKPLESEIELLYAKLIELSPDARLRYAGYLARQQRLDNALDVCETGLQPGNPLPTVAVAIGVLRTTRPNEQHLQRVENWLQPAIENQPDSIGGLLQLADLRDLQQRYDDTILIHRTILKQSPTNIVSLNNLAWLLSVYKSEHDEAESLVNRAIEIAGPVAVLLDTRGTIRSNRGATDAAIRDFREAIAQADGPVTRFHLAQAYQSSGNPQSAAIELKESLAGGISESTLHPLELPAFQTLVQQVGRP